MSLLLFLSKCKGYAFHVGLKPEVLPDDTTVRVRAHHGRVGLARKSLREGWEAAMADIPLEVYARDHQALAKAMEAYG